MTLKARSGNAGTREAQESDSATERGSDEDPWDQFFLVGPAFQPVSGGRGGITLPTPNSERPGVLNTAHLSHFTSCPGAPSRPVGIHALLQHFARTFHLLVPALRLLVRTFRATPATGANQATRFLPHGEA